MFFTDLISWWYFRGWGIFLRNFRTKIGDTFDLFSIGDMMRTLFKPYRQIATNSTSESATSAFFDRLISRFVGMFARLFIILAGTITIIAEIIIGGVLAIVWPVVPLMPVVGVILTVVGVTL